MGVAALLIMTSSAWADKARQLGEMLRAKRKVRGISMASAAEAAGISRITLYRLEKGEPSVSWGAWLAAADAIGADLQLTDAGEGSRADEAFAGDSLPLSIRMNEFPELRRLAWQLGKRVEVLTPQEAAGLYARNARHLNRSALTERESRLMRALRQVVSADVPDV
jgi:transcriptional regulator with XRE-family HTH domain